MMDVPIHEEFCHAFYGTSQGQAPNPVRASRRLDDLMVVVGKRVGLEVASAVLIHCPSDHGQGLAVCLPEASMSAEWIFLEDGRCKCVHLDRWGGMQPNEGLIGKIAGNQARFGTPMNSHPPTEWRNDGCSYPCLILRSQRCTTELRT